MVWLRKLRKYKTKDSFINILDSLDEIDLNSLKYAALASVYTLQQSYMNLRSNIYSLSELIALKRLIFLQAYLVI